MKFKAPTLEFWISKNLPAQRYEVYAHRDADGKHFVGLPLAVQEITPEQEGMHLPPTLTLRDDEAQQLLDALWRAGVRPSDDVGSTGHLSALQDHLKDMRQLVAAFMELKK